jgi:membrane protein required for colicin V production
MQISTLNNIDYAIMGVIALSSLISLIRGFVREALSLVAWILAFWVALSFSNELANRLVDHISVPSVRMAAAFFILFVGTLIIVAIANHLIANIVDKTGLSGTDRILGVVFGFARGMLLVALLLLVAQVGSMPQQQSWKQSRFIPVFLPIEAWLYGFLPKDLSKDLVTPEDTVVETK